MMRNFYKHSIEEILNLTSAGYSHPAVVDGKLVKCKGLSCNVCDLNKYHACGHSCTKEFLSWLYSEADPEKEENKNDQSKEIEDLQKAIWYINRSIEQISKEKTE